MAEWFARVETRRHARGVWAAGDEVYGNDPRLRCRVRGGRNRPRAGHRLQPPATPGLAAAAAPGHAPVWAVPPARGTATAGREIPAAACPRPVPGRPGPGLAGRRTGSARRAWPG